MLSPETSVSADRMFVSKLRIGGITVVDQMKDYLRLYFLLPSSTLAETRNFCLSLFVLVSFLPIISEARTDADLASFEERLFSVAS